MPLAKIHVVEGRYDDDPIKALTAAVIPATNGVAPAKE